MINYRVTLDEKWLVSALPMPGNTTSVVRTFRQIDHTPLIWAYYLITVHHVSGLSFTTQYGTNTTFDSSTSKPSTILTMIGEEDYKTLRDSSTTSTTSV